MKPTPLFRPSAGHWPVRLFVVLGSLLAALASYAQKPDFKKFDLELKNRLDGKCIGYAYIVTDNLNVTPILRSGGYERLAQDPPQKQFSLFDPLNPASICKTITGVALLKQLHDLHLKPTDAIGPYLPKDWKQGYGIKDITFAQLLRHESGLRDIVFWLDYDQLKTMMANGISSAPDAKKYMYQNSNFCLMRILIAYLSGKMSYAPGEDASTAAGLAYEKYVNDHIFNPILIPDLTCKPEAQGQSLAYQFPNNGKKGGDFGDWTKYNGGAGWNISVAQYSMFLRNLLCTERLLSKEDRQMMLDNQYALDQTGYMPTLKTKFYRKNGGFPSDMNPGGLNTEAWLFSNGMTVTLFVNSDVQGPDRVNDIIYKAYEAASK